MRHRVTWVVCAVWAACGEKELRYHELVQELGTAHFVRRPPDAAEGTVEFYSGGSVLQEVHSTGTFEPADDKSYDLVRVPIALLRAGMKLTALIPAIAGDRINEELKKEGVDFDVRNLKAQDLEDLVDALRELEIDVENPQQKVRVFVE